LWDASLAWRCASHRWLRIRRKYSAVEVRRPAPEGDKSRTFSLASSPQDKEPIMVAMRMRKTAFKSALKAAALATKFIVSHPRGSFTLHEDITRPAVFLAGVSGLRPFAASFSGPLRNVCRTNYICSIQTGRQTTRRLSKNLKACTRKIPILFSSRRSQEIELSLGPMKKVM
jgi:ferredoxin-NADP reductase